MTRLQLRKILDQKLTAEQCEKLNENGYVIMDGVFGNETCQNYLNEMKFLMENGFVKPNKTQFATPDGKVALFTKPNIFELDLHDECIRNCTMLPQFYQLFRQEELVQVLDEKLPHLSLVSGLNGKTIKLQINEGQGACFPWHYDNPGRPNRRQLTCLVYLNQNWKKGDGGELQLMPFLQKEITIEPLFDRMVIFYSDRILHRVLPAHTKRYCFTIWIDGQNVNRDEHVLLKAKHIDTSEQGFHFAIRTLQQSPLQRVISRAVYAEEYERSLRECMQDAPGSTLMIASHHKYLEDTRANILLQTFVDACRKYRVDHVQSIIP